MGDGEERDALLEEALVLLQDRLEQECREILEDEDEGDLAAEIKRRARAKVQHHLREGLADEIDRLGQEIVEEMAARARRKEKIRKREEEFERLGLQFRIQHMMMIASVVLLIFTGLPVKFPDFVLSEKLIYLFGGIYNSTILHRIGAVGLILAAIYHALYTILSREGRRDFFLLLPRPKDLMDLIAQVRFFVGRSEEHARFGRFSYIEKFDYWAVYWGCIIMIGSGAMLWFQDITLLYLPKYGLDIAKEAHSDEALLASLAIIIWHFYNVHLNPATFPGSLTWWHGRISREEMIEHHPLEYERIMAERAAQAKTEVQAPLDNVHGEKGGSVLTLGVARGCGRSAKQG